MSIPGYKPNKKPSQRKISTKPDQPISSLSSFGDDKGFINPYNFVQWLPYVHRCMPRTHEKFAGLSGRIIIELTNITPICIPDTEKTIKKPIGNGKERDCKPFMKVDNKPYIPGSALKGMLRSVAEAASNSCYSIFVENMAVFRDNRKYIPESQCVGVLNQKSNGSLFLADPSPGKSVSTVTFSKRGLFYQDKRSYHPRGNNPKATRQIIPNEIRDNYKCMIDDDNFTLKDQNREYRPSKTQSDLLLNFTGNEPWWFREASIPIKSKGVSRKVITFGRNFRYKWAYNPLNALPENLYPCDKPNDLCPCCSIFGMVEQKQDSQRDEGEVNAIAGKISIGPARWVSGNYIYKTAEDHKILGSPKFSCRSFYLKPTDENSFDVGTDEFASIENGKIVTNHIRGRKFYWHQDKLWDDKNDIKYIERLQYIDEKTKEVISPEKTDQNAVIEILLPQVKFEFAIEFENLSDWQLGLLLWSIELPDVPEGAHHIGLGKPIGLGTVTLKAKQIDMICRKERYTNLFATGVKKCESIDLKDANGEFGKYVNSFLHRMVEWHKMDFQDLPNIKDLMIILSRQRPTCVQKGKVEIMYPPGDDPYNPNKKPDPDKDNVHPSELHYEWFCRTKKWRQRLFTIQEIADGKYQDFKPEGD